MAVVAARFVFPFAVVDVAAVQFVFPFVAVAVVAEAHTSVPFAEAAFGVVVHFFQMFLLPVAAVAGCRYFH